MFIQESITRLGQIDPRHTQFITLPILEDRMKYYKHKLCKHIMTIIVNV